MLSSFLSSLSKVILMGIAVLAPVHSVMLTTGALIFIDLVTGIWRAIKDGEKVTSNGLRRTITKILAYNLAIVTALILEKSLLDFIPVVKIVAGLIALTECKSIYENLGNITGLNFWQELLKKLQGSKEQDKPTLEDKKD